MRALRFCEHIKVNVVVFKFGISLLTLLSLSSPLQAEDLEPFASDGCSAFPDGTIEQNQLWLKCCAKHDYAYWKGGTYQERVDADIELKSCVSTVGEKEIALLMLAGVRVGGSPYLPTPFRWGYGWPYPKFYGNLTPEELLEVENVTNKARGTP